ncbi:type II secretion system protein N [Sulfuriferula thiophila]|uniref:type II secretion system protein N n=1 Tax=Sulfuriferula thiophila TaxID=1781211 RepID=UPI000F606DAD|nr:type II secretion system protein N [Sulfuriferula thiophila]
MKRLTIITIGLAVYTLAIIITAPATLMDTALQRISQGKLRLVETQGTLWSGTGQLEIRDTSGRAGGAQSLAWHMQPASLLRGHLVYLLNLAQSTQPVTVTLSVSQVEITNADINLPATVLGLAIPKLAPLGLSGDLSLHVANLTFASDRMQGNTSLQWRDAGSAFTTVSPLGDYELTLNGDGATTHALLRTLQGPLKLDGKGTWANGDKPNFLATAQVPPQQQQQLDPLLRLIAVTRGAGSYELQLK